jgi:hypothetical protein
VPLTILQLCEQWQFVVADFASEYGIRLATVTDLSWREFCALLLGLLSANTRLARYVASDRDGEVMP